MVELVMGKVPMSPEQAKLVSDAGYLLWARERTAYTLSRGPNGRVAEMRYRFGNGGALEGADVAVDTMVIDMLEEAVELGKRGK